MARLCVFHTHRLRESPFLLLIVICVYSGNDLLRANDGAHNLANIKD